MKYLLSLILLCSIMVSCKKSNDTTNNNPEALAVNDNSSAGVYKGVLVGSSGTVKIVLLNGNTTIQAFVKFNGYTETLTATTSVVSGQAINNLVFVGSKMSFSFSTSANGATSSITNITYAGYPNPIQAIVAKELSTQLVSCYEGNFVTLIGTSGNGTFNCIVFGNTIIGLTSSFDKVTGSVSGSGVISASGDVSSGAIFNGTATGNTCQGNWSNNISGNSGEWQGTKTL